MNPGNTDPFAAMAAMGNFGNFGELMGSMGATSGPVNTVLAQAGWISATTMSRVWARGAQSLAEYQQACAAGTPLEVQVDHARAHLRRLGEIALEEARSLDGQMQGLGEQLRGAVPDAVPDPPRPTADPPVRRARAKP